MKGLSKIVSAVCIVPMLALAVAGCGGSDSSSSSEGAKASGNKPVTLRFSWWGSDPRHKATLDVIALYESKNPNVKIEGEYMGADGYKEKLMTQLAGGSAPDIMQIDPPWLADFTKQFNSFEDLNQLKSIDTKSFDEAFVNNYGVVNGKLVGLPTGISGITMLINKDVLTKAGISPDTVWDWDTILSEGAKVNKADPKSYFLVTDQFATVVQILPPYLKQKTGSQIVKEDYTLGFTRADLVDAFIYLKKLFDQKVVEPAAQQYMFKAKYFENSVWTNQQAGATIEWIAALGPRKEPFKNSADVVLPPVAKDAKDTGIIVRPAQMISINGKSANKEEAAKFLNFFFNDKEALAILKDTRSVPPTEIGRKVSADSNLIDPLILKAIDLATKKQGMADNVISLNIQLQNIMMDAVEKVGFGKATPEAAADEMIKQFQTKLTELRAAAK
ncbi:carbohydrate ABC transporter substrate-binding protein [Paenibacillus hemerocallicola]|uniref:Carbohydrate ABC transporter substrate-binding protein n=1 Tax=Paenibacillus hemerocallicola TaxID=1172614 RepID=A0A5C4SYL7_9BACL|nr:ABC transporter substrate-binding protein [Paenibacillus hemerocallicola]TNJ61603.1 carbohydrate ABC transporter substrate-binding protein [Paenibacillus hemerocallicola]